MTAAALATAVADAEVVELRLRSAYAVPPRIVVHAALVDAAGEPTVDGAPGELTATVASQPVRVRSVRPLGAADGVAFVVLVDVSRSLTAAQFAHARAGLVEWLDALEPADRVALVSFGRDVVVEQDFTGDRAALRAAVDRLAPRDDVTRLHQALLRGTALAGRPDPDLPSYRVVIVFSDGQDDDAGGPTSEEVTEALRDRHVPVYALGLAPHTPTAAARQALRALGAFARTSGGDYREVASADVRPGYAVLRQAIRRVLVLDLDCGACSWDTQPHRVEVVRTAGGMRLADALAVRLVPSPAVEPASAVHPMLVGAGAAVLVAVIVVVARMRRGTTSRAIPIGAEVTETSSPPAMRVLLTVMGSADTARCYEVGLVERLVIGRDPACDVVIDADAEVSARHCVLVRQADGVYVADAGSRNGTLLNGVPLRGPHRVRDHDLLLLGRTELRLRLVEV